MSSKWGSYAKAAQQSSGGKYVRLKDGDSIKFAVTDAKIGQQTTWWKDGAKVDEGTPEATKSVKIVLCVYDLDQLAMRVLSITPNTFRTLAEKIDEFGENRIYRIKRYIDGKGFVAYAVDQIDRLEAEQVERIARDNPIDILAENDVYPLEAVAETPTKPKHTPPAMPSTKSTQPAKPQARPSAMPPGDEGPLPDESIPF